MKKLLLLPLLCAGCVMVPASKIQIGPASLQIPKNIEVVGLTVDIQGSNVIKVSAQSIKSSNDPAVIDKTAAGQVAILREWGSQVRQTGEAVALKLVP